MKTDHAGCLVWAARTVAFRLFALLQYSGIILLVVGFLIRVFSGLAVKGLIKQKVKEIEK